MEHKKTFCENCRSDVNFKILEKEMYNYIKEVKYKYMAKEAFCVECNSEVYFNYISDYNLNSLYSEYRKKNNIISLKKVLEIPKKYNIGKRPLSLLLGWGELTFSRYLEGDIPTKQYSEVLQNIYDDPKYYLNILETNKDNLKSEFTYIKSKKAVENLLSGTEVKMNSIIKYILNKCEDITPLALQKLLYYVQGFNYAFNKTFAFNTECEAWVHGPVYKDIYFKYKDYTCNPITKNVENIDFELSLDEKEVIDNVIKYLGCYSGRVLEKFTHLETPWIDARGNIDENESSDKVIEKEVIGSYFNNIKEEYKLNTSDDIKNYTEYLFNKI